MKFDNDLTITIEYNMFIQLTSNLSYISCIVDRYDGDVTNESITLGVDCFT